MVHVVSATLEFGAYRPIHKKDVRDVKVVHVASATFLQNQEKTRLEAASGVSTFLVLNVLGDLVLAARRASRYFLLLIDRPT